MYLRSYLCWSSQGSAFGGPVYVFPPQWNILPSLWMTVTPTANRIKHILRWTNKDSYIIIFYVQNTVTKKYICNVFSGEAAEMGRRVGLCLWMEFSHLCIVLYGVARRVAELFCLVFSRKYRGRGRESTFCLFRDAHHARCAWFQTVLFLGFQKVLTFWLDGTWLALLQYITRCSVLLGWNK